jgi:hypothetical protein
LPIQFQNFRNPLILPILIQQVLECKKFFQQVFWNYPKFKFKKFGET